jgi:hypothetical protein
VAKVKTTTEKVIAAKEKTRKRLARKPVEEKIKVLQKMQQDAAPILKNRKKLILRLKSQVDFERIEQIYEFLEKEALNFEFEHQIADVFRRLRDKAAQEGDSTLTNLCQIEMDVFNFVYTDGYVSHKFGGTDRTGKEVKIPDIELLSKDGKILDYIEKRLNETKNEGLKHKYSSILWHSPKKHNKFAKIAINSYLYLFRLYWAADVESPNEHFGLHAANALKNAFHYAKQSRQLIKKVIDEIETFFREYPKRSSSLRAIHFWLLKMVTENKSSFTLKLLNELVDLCYKYATSIEVYAHTSIEYLEYGRRLDKSRIKYEWDKTVGTMHERLMEGAIKERQFSADQFWRLAIQSYRKAGDSDKVKELERREREISSTLHLGQIRTEVDMTPVIEGYKNRAEEITEYEADYILKYLSLSHDLLPNLDQVRSRVEESKSQHLLQWLATVQPMDTFGHTMNNISNEDEMYKHHLLSQYDMELRHFKIILIHSIIYEAVKKDKFNLINILDYLKRHSWLGELYSRPTIPGHELKYDWIGILSPALMEYFGIIKAHITNTIALNPVLVIDSLSLKIEGMLREMLRFMDVPTFINKKDNKGQPITQERTLDDLLRDKNLESLLEEGDIFFFKYLLVEKEGLNLRHNVAHCLLTYEHYSIYHAHLLVVALLRIGKYVLSAGDDED